MYLYCCIGIYITHVILHSDSYLYGCLAYICEGIFDLRIYVAVTSPYPRDRDVTVSVELSGASPCALFPVSDFSCNIDSTSNIISLLVKVLLISRS